jgi:hypothetical protein
LGRVLLRNSGESITGDEQGLIPILGRRTWLLFGLNLKRYTLYRSRDSSVGIATGYGLDDRGVGVRVPVGSSIFSSPHLPDRLWGQHNLLSNGYRGALSPELSCRSVKAQYIRFHGVVLN